MDRRQSSAMSSRRSSSRDEGPSHEDYPSRTQHQQRPPRRSRPAHMDCDGPSVPADPSRSSSAQPQHQDPASPEPAAQAPPQVFDFFYQLIFSFIHAALTVLLTPVMKKKGDKADTGRRRAPSRQGKPESFPRSRGRSPSPDPEMAMHHQHQHHRHHSSPVPECESVSGGSTSSGGSHVSYGSHGSYQPILRSSRRSSEIMVENKKTVNFCPPERSRPPLGRIGGPSVGSSGSASSSSSRGDRRERSRPASSSSSGRNPNRGGQRRTSSPLEQMASPRMGHSTYFLE